MALAGSDPEPAGGEPVAVAETFVNAVAWGEHLRVWELLSAEARRVVIRVAVGRGMDETLAARLREGAAGRVERDTFLTDLVNGLRADLRGSDLDHLVYQVAPGEQADGGHAQVLVMVPVVNAALGAPLPVATVELAKERGEWRVEQLLSRIQK